MAGGGSTLEETPAFAAATVFFVLVLVSVIIEKILHLTGHWLKHRNNIGLYQALEKIKSELMLVGFISLLLTVSQNSVTTICIDARVAKSWLPCKKNSPEKNLADSEQSDRRLLSDLDFSRRILAGGSSTVETSCKEGKVKFLSLEALHELHLIIFVLACVHVVCCLLTMVLSKAKMRRWREWEKETKTSEYQSSHSPEQHRIAKETSFGRRHLGYWATNAILLRVMCFFRQFFSSTPKVDYLTLRHGFMVEHLTPNNYESFDFHEFIDRSLEDDFKVVVGIHPTIWFAAVLSLLFNKYEFRHSLWIPTIPLLLLVVVGTKLQVIIAKMAHKIEERGETVIGQPVVEVGDHLFWFRTPRLLLYILNFILFQNAFHIAFYLYTWIKFGIKSCFHRSTVEKIIILSMGLLVLILCSYVTLPLYALVTQMGSTMRDTALSEKVAKSLKTCHHTTREQGNHHNHDACLLHLLSRETTHQNGHEELDIEDTSLHPDENDGEIQLTVMNIRGARLVNVGSREPYIARRSWSCK